MSAKAKPKKKSRKLDPAAVKAAREVRKRIARAVQMADKSGSKYSAERIARAVRQSFSSSRQLAADALQSLHELAAASGTTPAIDIRDKGIKSYWALRRRFDSLTGQLELFR